MKKLGTYLTFMLICLSLLGQDDVKATLKSSSSTVQVGELFEVIVESSVNGSVDLRFPNEFQVLGRQSGGSAFTITINGRNVTQNDAKSEVKYTVRATKSGTYQLANGKFNYPGGSVNLNTLTIKVQDAPPVSNSLRSNLSKPFFGIVSPSRSEVYVGEPFTVTTKVYAKARIANVSNYEPHKIEGRVYKTDLFKQLENLQVKNEQVEGVNFQTIKLAEDLIIPQESGEITISPFQIQLGYQGNFIFTDYTNITSGSAKIRVLPLPADKPGSFNGAVGNYSLKGSINTAELKEGEIFVYTLTIEGKGNLHLLTVPELDLPDGLELYGDPKKNEKISMTASGGEGKIEVEYTIQAQEKGIYSWKPLEFSFFNPQTKKYVQVDLEPASLLVLKGEFVAGEESTLARDASIKAKGLRYWQENPNPVDDHFLYGSWLFWSLLTLSLAGGLSVGLLLNYRTTHAKDIARSQTQRNALKACMQRLNEANQANLSGDYRKYAEGARQALIHFISDKSGLLSTELTKEKIKEQLTAHEIDAQLTANFIGTLEELEFIQYAGGMPRQQFNETLIQLTQQLDSAWK
jgi:hypothetical protein